MRNLLPNKVEHYKVFADAVEQQFKLLRYGITTRKQKTSLNVALLRKDIVDWQKNEDAQALTTASIRYTTWLPVKYDVNTSGNLANSSGVSTSATSASPSVSMGYNYSGGNTQNIIDINVGGNITRINLNPIITIDNSKIDQYTHHQQTASATWNITHSLGFVPNILTTNLTGQEIMGVVNSATTTTLVIQFSEPVTGYAYLS